MFERARSITEEAFKTALNSIKVWWKSSLFIISWWRCHLLCYVHTNMHAYIHLCIHSYMRTKIWLSGHPSSQSRNSWKQVTKWLHPVHLHHQCQLSAYRINMLAEAFTTVWRCFVIFWLYIQWKTFSQEQSKRTTLVRFVCMDCVVTDSAQENSI